MGILAVAATLAVARRLPGVPRPGATYRGADSPGACPRGRPRGQTSSQSTSSPGVFTRPRWSRSATHGIRRVRGAGCPRRAFVGCRPGVARSLSATARDGNGARRAGPDDRRRRDGQRRRLGGAVARALAGPLQNENSALQSTLGTVGTLAAGFFLITIGLMNLSALFGIMHAYRHWKAGAFDDEALEDHRVPDGSRLRHRDPGRTPGAGLRDRRARTAVVRDPRAAEPVRGRDAAVRQHRRGRDDLGPTAGPSSTPAARSPTTPR